MQAPRSPEEEEAQLLAALRASEAEAEAEAGARRERGGGGERAPPGATSETESAYLEKMRAEVLAAQAAEHAALRAEREARLRERDGWSAAAREWAETHRRRSGRADPRGARRIVRDDDDDDDLARALRLSRLEDDARRRRASPPAPSAPFAPPGWDPRGGTAYYPVRPTVHAPTPTPTPIAPPPPETVLRADDDDARLAEAVARSREDAELEEALRRSLRETTRDIPTDATRTDPTDADPTDASNANPTSDRATSTTSTSAFAAPPPRRPFFQAERRSRARAAESFESAARAREEKVWASA